MKYPRSILRTKRKSHGYTIAEQAKDYECGRTTLGQVETGRLLASESLKRRIANYWGVNIDELFDSTGRARFANN